MPIEIRPQTPSICVRRGAFEGAALTRAGIDAALGLTADEFHVEGDLIVIGPLYGDAPTRLIELFEAAGLQYYDDFFELSGNWPEWLRLFARYERPH